MDAGTGADKDANARARAHTHTVGHVLFDLDDVCAGSVRQGKPAGVCANVSVSVYKHVVVWVDMCTRTNVNVCLHWYDVFCACTYPRMCNHAYTRTQPQTQTLPHIPCTHTFTIEYSSSLLPCLGGSSGVVATCSQSLPSNTCACNMQHHRVCCV